MLEKIPQQGSAAAELSPAMFAVFSGVAGDTLDITQFRPEVSLFERLAAAAAAGMEIGGVLSRYSSDMQHSTSAQVLDCVRYATAHKIYVPHEFVCVDEAVSGRKQRRAGLDRMTALLREMLVKVLLVFKVSRLFRVVYKGFQFVQEEVVDEGLRAVSISQGIDTADQKTWKQLMYLYGMMDEMLLSTIADHVRSGLSHLFDAGFVTGPLTLGYHGVEVPGGRPTKRGLPRRMPAVLPEVADLIRKHYELVRDGMPLREGLKRWVAAGGPSDSRSKGRMTAGAYRRMLSNPRYIGVWAFGRTRSEWSTKRDYAKQVEQPETEVRVVRSEDLRIVSDELYFGVQQRLADKKLGTLGPKRRRDPQLCDLVTDCFYCGVCRERFYQGGAHGNGMRCKNGSFCPQLTVVERTTAVQAVCGRLQELLLADEEFLVELVSRAQEADAAGDQEAERQLRETEREIAALARKIDALTEMAGDGTPEDRAELRNKVRAAQARRTEMQSRRSMLHTELSSAKTVITPEDVRKQLQSFTELLEQGANGRLGDDLKFRAAEVFRLLVGGRINVYVLPRPGRKLTSVLGKFTPVLLQTTRTACGVRRSEAADGAAEVQVWLRKPPLADELAPRVHHMIDVDGLSFRAAAKVLQAEGFRLNNGGVYQIYRRYYEMIGQPMPQRPARGRRRPRDDGEK